MSISSVLDIGKTGLIAQQLALDVTSDNITNVNTPGYMRQTPVLQTAPSTIVNGNSLGSGVQVSAVQRSYDGFLQSQIVAENSASGQANTTNSALQMVQTQFNDLSSSGLATSLQTFFSSWQDLSANPQGVPEREAVLSAGQQLASDFNQISGNLTGQQASMDQSLTGLTADINNQLTQVAALNGQIREAEAQGGQANDMSDQRDLLIQQLATNVGVTATQQQDGTISVNLSSGQALVTGTKAASLSLQASSTNSGYSDVMLTSPGGVSAIDVTSSIGGPNNSQGNIGATLQMRDTTVPGYLSSLNELASTVASQVNAVQSAGYGLTGTTGLPFFSASATAATMAVNITSTSDIAAAAADPTGAGGGTGDNLNAQKMANLYTAPLAMTGGTMTMADFYNGLVGKVGVDVQAAGNAQTQATSMVSQLSNLQDSNSGVSLDEELTNLTKYQYAYQGAAKLINVGTEMLDTLLGMVT